MQIDPFKKLPVAVLYVPKNGTEISYANNMAMELFKGNDLIGCNIGQILSGVIHENTHLEKTGSLTFSALTVNGGVAYFMREGKEKCDPWILNNIHDAIENNQFALDFQPQIDFRTGNIIGAEALIRWHHPIHGTIPPSRFIPTAEETGQIQLLGQFVLDCAVSQCKQWQAIKNNVRVAVNISSKQINHELPNYLSKLLNKHSLSPNLLELELTESYLVEDAKATISILQSIKNMGIGVALDDFGTGWSSLSYLKDFPADTIKIDRSFIGPCCQDIDLRMARAIIGIAKEYGMNVLAEGIENKQQKEALKTLGCDFWQGYLFSKPVPIDIFTSYLKQ